MVGGVGEAITGRRLSSLLIAALIFSACSSRALKTDAEGTLGPAGGTVASETGASVLVPPGALSSSTRIKIRALPNPFTPKDTTIVGQAYVFEPEGLQFAQEVTVTLPLDAKRFPAGSTADDVAIYSAPTGTATYERLPTSLIHASRVAAPTRHFSVFLPAVPTDTPDAGAMPDAPGTDDASHDRADLPGSSVDGEDVPAELPGDPPGDLPRDGGTSDVPRLPACTAGPWSTEDVPPGIGGGILILDSIGGLHMVGGVYTHRPLGGVWSPRWSFDGIAKALAVDIDFGLHMFDGDYATREVLGEEWLVRQPSPTFGIAVASKHSPAVSIGATRTVYLAQLIRGLVGPTPRSAIVLGKRIAGSLGWEEVPWTLPLQPTESPLVELDGAGTLHVATAGVQYSRRADGQAWISSTVDVGDSPLALRVDVSGGVHLVYQAASLLRYAYRPTSGTWTVSDVGDLSGFTGSGGGGTFGADDFAFVVSVSAEPHLAYRLGLTTDAGTSDEVRYARRTPSGTWATETIATGGSVKLGRQAITVAPNGEVTIVYLVEGQPWKLARCPGTGPAGFTLPPAGSWAWTYRPVPSPAPAGRRYHASAYDSARGKVVMFGGSTGPVANHFPRPPAVDDTWEWDGASGTWSRSTPTTSPSIRCGHAMAYDPDRQKVVLFGGMDPDPAATSAWAAPDVWEWDGAAGTWSIRTRVGSPPPARALTSMAYDSVRKKMVVFGGGLEGGTPTNDTWEWDGATGTWTDRTPAGSPSPRMWGTLVYDAARARVLMFGGRGTPEYLADTWEWDGQAGTWTQRPTSGDAPIGSFDVGLAPGPRGKPVMWGGVPTTGLLVGPTFVWEWDGAAGQWSRFAVFAFGPPRRGTTLSYDAQRSSLVFFGGYYSLPNPTYGDGLALGDTWELKQR